MLCSSRSRCASVALTALSAFAVASHATAQPPLPEQLSTARQASGVPTMGWIDTDQIRRQFLGDTPDWQMQAAVFPWSLQRSSVVVPVNPMGMATMALPAYLRSPEMSLDENIGQLVTHIVDGSVAHRAGLQIGMTIVEIDGRPLPSTADLTPLVGVHSLVVFTNEGPRRVDVEAPSIENELVAPNPPIVETSASTRSLSVSEANGIMAVAAIIDTEWGTERVELKGNRAQVELQLRQLAPCVQQALRPHLH